MKSSKHFLFSKARPLDPRKLPEVYRVMRKAFGHQHWWPGDTPFEVMVGAILTQNTAWKNVEKAISNLKKARKLSAKAIHRMPPRQLAVLIRPAGYFNVKADRLKHFVNFFFREYGGKIKRMKSEKGKVLREKLLAVKGIGAETADSILLYALGKPFFVIDAYTKRIFNRHRLKIFKDSSFDRRRMSMDYHDWQKVFLSRLPLSPGLFNDYHAQIVALGKDFCKASSPLCPSCPLYPYL